MEWVPSADWYQEVFDGVLRESRCSTLTILFGPVVKCSHKVTTDAVSRALPVMKRIALKILGDGTRASVYVQT